MDTQQHSTTADSHLSWDDVQDTLDKIAALPRESLMSSSAQHLAQNLAQGVRASMAGHVCTDLCPTPDHDETATQESIAAGLNRIADQLAELVTTVRQSLAGAAAVPVPARTVPTCMEVNPDLPLLCERAAGHPQSVGHKDGAFTWGAAR